MIPLGIRNNNPLNIRSSAKSIWRGQINSNRGFCVFETPYYGYRAAAILLKKYILKGYDTVAKIVSRWAPSSENNTKAYISYVVADLRLRDEYTTINFTADTPLRSVNIETFDLIMDLIVAMEKYENGSTSVPANWMSYRFNALFDLFKR